MGAGFRGDVGLSAGTARRGNPLPRGVVRLAAEPDRSAPGAVLSSAVFAMLHFYDGYGLVSVGVFGFSCALLYSGTGALATVIVLHVLYNTSIKIPEWIVYHAPLG